MSKKTALFIAAALVVAAAAAYLLFPREPTVISTENNVVTVKGTRGGRAGGGAGGKAEREAVKKGIAQSSAVIDKIAALSTALSEELTEIDFEYGDKISFAQAKKAVLSSSLLNADNYFSDVFGYEVAAKEQEIKDAEQKTITEIFKYNNGLDEKEQRYSNTIKTSTRELELRYMDIASDFFSKDELVEMGYYDDAINCVCSYYDTLSDVQAYQKLVKDRKVAIYLDDYYSNVLYMVKTRAGL